MHLFEMYGAHRKQTRILRDNIQGLHIPAIKRLAHKAGAHYVSGLIYEEVRGVLKVFLDQLIRDVITLTEHKRHKTVSVYALNEALDYMRRARRYSCSVKLPAESRIDEELLDKRDSKGKRAGQAGAQWDVDKIAIGHCPTKSSEQLMDDPAIAQQVILRGKYKGDKISDHIKTIARPSGDTRRFARGDAASANVHYEQALKQMEVITRADRSGKARYNVDVQGSKYCFFFPRSSFARLVREIGQDYKIDLRWEPEVLQRIQLISELYAVSVLTKAASAAHHAGRVTVMPKDIQFARHVAGERA